MMQNIHIFKSPQELANTFAVQMMAWINDLPGNSFHLAISGGKTPDLLFEVLANEYADSILWQHTHFWWVDERMVSPDDPESNFGNAYKLLFSKINIPKENIHRVKGEYEARTEALSYSKQIGKLVPLSNGWPRFDLILLGMGDDGHTASIFPDQMYLLHSECICDVAIYPRDGLYRVTLTGRVITNALKICFLVTGSNKANRMSELSNNQEKASLLPAAHIHPVNGNLFWYVDQSSLGGQDD